ncbi:MAG TPA: Ig-like domain repeat protein, partial [Tepidisphaeraceae bacterium]|nr:Ig-like domain repeat protein [Tepidisphaeraceae bacterium]
GVAMLALTTLGVGSHTLTAVYSGDAEFAGGSSAALAQTISKVPTNTLLVSNAPLSTIGAAVTFSATVSGIGGVPSGLVGFFDGGNVIGQAVLVNGVASMTTTTLATGSHTITAMYLDDAMFAPSTSPAITQVVGIASSTTTLGSSANPALVGGTIVFSAHVTSASGSPSGTVTFFEGATVLGSADVFSGFAVFSIATLGFGSHNIIASYGGTTDFASSASATLVQVVGKAATTTSTGSSANPSTYGQVVGISASIFTAFGSPTGTVTFMDGTTLLGTAAVVNNLATLSIAALTSGNHTIIATYSGDANFAGSVADPLLQSVSLAPTTTSLAASSGVITIGQPETFTASVSAAVPGFGGTVTFRDGANLLGVASVINGVASLTTTGLSTGNHSITAGFSGDVNFAASNSAAVAVTVNLLASSTSLDVSANPVTVGDTLTLTATVSTAGAAGGSVSFFDGNTLLGSAALVNGHAVFATASLAVGGHSLTASYSGDVQYVASATSAVSLTVRPASTSTSLTSSASPANFGQAVQLTAAVDSTFAGAGGTVTFRDGSTLLGVVTLSNGVATLTVANFTAGGHSLSASYSGDASHTSSTGSTAQMINRGSTATAISSSSSTSTVGQSVTFTATVSSTVGSPSGSVTFTDGSTVIATIALSNGVAKLTTASLAAGGHSIVATYSGDTNFNANSSAPLTQLVTAATGTIAGHVYIDTTGNGFSADDRPFVGVIVELYLDRNKNGKVDGGDGSPVATSTSDASGAYTFTNVAVGQYVVQQVVPGGYTQSAPSAASYSLNVTAGSVTGGLDFDDLLSTGNGKGKKK